MIHWWAEPVQSLRAFEVSDLGGEGKEMTSRKGNGLKEEM